MATYNVQDYGADPTGASDSLPAFQQACDAAQTGDVVYVPAVANPSTDFYRFSYDPNTVEATGLSLDETHNGITVEGESLDAIIKVDAAGDRVHNGIRIRNSGGTVRDLTIRTLTVDGNKSAQSYFNGLGVAVYEDTNADNVVIENVRAQNWKNTGISAHGGTTVRYCDAVDNEKHGIATNGGDTVEFCECWGNDLYGVDLQGDATFTDSYLHDNAYGWKIGDDGSGGTVTAKRIWADGGSYGTNIGFQVTGTFQDLYLEDCLVENFDSWGWRFDNNGGLAARVHITGEGIMSRNTERDGGNLPAIRTDDVTFVDSASSDSIIQVDTSGLGSNPGMNTGGSGVVDYLHWENCSSGIRNTGGLTVKNVTQQATSAPSTLPSDSATGTQGFGGTSDADPGSGDSTTDPTDTSATIGVLQASSPGVLAAVAGSPTRAIVRPTPTGPTVVEDFETQGSWTWSVVDVSTESPGSAVNGSKVLKSPTGNFQGDSVQTVSGEAFGYGEKSRVYVYQDDGMVLRVLWGLDTSDNGYRFELSTATGNVDLERQDAGSPTDLAVTSVSSLPNDQWNYVDITWDDGSLGGSAGNLTVEFFDGSTDTSLGSVTGNDTTYTAGVGVGFYVSGLSGNAFFDYWHKDVLE